MTKYSDAKTEEKKKKEERNKKRCAIKFCVFVSGRSPILPPPSFFFGGRERGGERLALFGWAARHTPEEIDRQLAERIDSECCVSSPTKMLPPQAEVHRGRN